MSKSGQNNYKGVNAQVWAAMSLFLQHLRYSKFSYIHLESDHFEDFDLIFSDGKKIICESKDRKERFNYADLRELLGKVANKNLSDDDEILVICSSLNPQLLSDVKHARYWDALKDKFRKKDYTPEMIDLLPKVKFWEVKSNLTQKTVYALFADVLNFWLPEEEVVRIADSILMQKFYSGSAIGATYSRADILKEVNSLASEERQNSVYYNEQLSKREEQFWELDKALANSNHPTWKVPKELSAFSTDFERLKFVKDRLAGKRDQLVLENWDPIWKLNRIYIFHFGIFEIFENNLHTSQNRRYVIEYVKKYTKSIRNFYRSDYFDVNVVKIVNKILESEDGNTYLRDAFTIVADLLTFDEDEFFYLKDKGRDQGIWEKEQICGLLEKIYSRANPKLKDQILELVVRIFNITEDDGEFDWHAPQQVYGIIRAWLEEDFEGRFKTLVKMISDQYDRYYKGFGTKLAFKGWEHMGGSTSFWGNNYHVGDRHFIGILAPALRRFYEQDPKKGWRFILRNCVSRTKDVTKNKPDFLNRSVYGIVLDRYAMEDKDISNQAFKILSEFLLSRKGIPHKSDLIYQALVNSKLPEDKKWRLVNLTIKKYKVPVNPFAGQIVTQLAEKGHEEAIATLKDWFNNPEYYKRFHSEEDSASSIEKLLNTNLDLAIELYKSLITGDKVKGKSDRFSAYPIATLLHDILKLDYQKGLGIFRL